MQALIFTAILQGVVSIVRWFFLLSGHFVVIGAWTENVGLVWSLLWAAVLGVGTAGIANNDVIHAWLRRRDWMLRRVTTPESEHKWAWSHRTSPPSEWFSAFSNHNRRYVILHLRDGRRLFGWPDEWPDACDRGHFVVSECEWLLPTGERAPFHQVESMLIPATSVEFVEFLKYDSEVKASAEQLREAEDLLIRVNQQENADGKQSSPTAPKPTREVREEGRELQAGSRSQAQAVATPAARAQETVVTEPDPATCLKE